VRGEGGGREEGGSEGGEEGGVCDSSKAPVSGWVACVWGEGEDDSRAVLRVHMVCAYVYGSVVGSGAGSENRD